MGNFVAIHVLKQYNPGTFNRGEDGEAKQIMIGGTNRVRFSSQCQKRAVRDLMGVAEITTSRIETLINKLLTVKVEDGTITDKERDALGKIIGSKSIIGTDCWDKLGKTAAEIKNDKNMKGNLVVNTNASEMNALVNTFVDKLKENGIEYVEKNKEKIAREAALSDITYSIAKSLFGTMATDGVLGTVDGALQMGQAFSVDEYTPESDFFTVRFTGRSGADKTDPFWGAYDDYNAMESQKQNGETINAGLTLYSNLMYEYANININELKRNLGTFIGDKHFFETEDLNTTTATTAAEFIQTMILMTPEATQRRSASYVEPAAVLIEVIEDGFNLQPDWSELISLNEKTIAKQAINTLSKFANNKTFRAGKVKQYIMLGSNYEDLSELFKDAKQITSLSELKDCLTEDATSLC